MQGSYLDTSVLLKAYVHEAGSDAFIDWMIEQKAGCISSLSLIELRCAVKRRVRSGLIDARRANSVLADFDAELAEDQYRLLDWPMSAFESGSTLLDGVGNIALRTLDALHLAVARHHHCAGFATADRVQAQAAKKLGFNVHTFFDPE